ncbi:MAG: hypothetical protein M1827_001932 [Pycnora praestabilis]|nr:MAG: hypothetical protein M1827_001932 [Pycnora praestabilis]
MCPTLIAVFAFICSVAATPTQQLQERARSGNADSLPDTLPSCNLFYGNPLPSDCQNAVLAMPSGSRVNEFLDTGTVRRYFPHPVVNLPLFYEGGLYHLDMLLRLQGVTHIKAGNCRISVFMNEGGETSNVRGIPYENLIIAALREKDGTTGFSEPTDLATNIDVRYNGAQTIIDDCVLQQCSGGYINLGSFDSIRVYVYAYGSQFDSTLDDIYKGQIIDSLGRLELDASSSNASPEPNSGTVPETCAAKSATSDQAPANIPNPPTVQSVGKAAYCGLFVDAQGCGKGFNCVAITDASGRNMLKELFGTARGIGLCTGIKS